MCITEDENKELKHTYEGVLEEKQNQLIALKQNIIALDEKTVEKRK